MGNQPNRGGFPQTPGSKADVNKKRQFNHSRSQKSQKFFYFCCNFQRYDSASSLDQSSAYIIFHVALVEHIEESCRAHHDQGGEYDAIEYSLKGKKCNKKFRNKKIQMCERKNLNEGNDSIGDNLTTASLPWTCFGSI